MNLSGKLVSVLFGKRAAATLKIAIATVALVQAIQDYRSIGKKKPHRGC